MKKDKETKKEEKVEQKEQEKAKYVFPKTFADLMAKTTPQFQFEAMMMSLVMIILGLITTSIYVIFFTNFSLFLKIMTGINSFFGIMFLYSQLVTTFQQYQSIMEVLNVNEIFRDSELNIQSMKGGS